jgi:hypothetical protein
MRMKTHRCRRLTESGISAIHLIGKLTLGGLQVKPVNVPGTSGSCKVSDFATDYESVGVSSESV